MDMPGSSNEVEIIPTLAVAYDRKPVHHGHLGTQIAIAAAFILVGLGWYYLASANTAQLTIDFGNNQRRAFKGQLVSGMTVLDALNASVLAGKIPMAFEMAQDKIKIISLDDHRNVTEDPRVSFKVNNQVINASDINHIMVQPKDKIEVKLP